MFKAFILVTLVALLLLNVAYLHSIKALKGNAYIKAYKHSIALQKAFVFAVCLVVVIL